MNPQPVPPHERIAGLDVLRGAAVLGILMVNIQSFSMIEAARPNPGAHFEFTGLNRGIWIFTHVFFEMKFMALFSVLFGAGICLMTERVASAAQYPATRHYLRMGWLLAAGVLHGLLLWHGDVLLLYALCGSVLFWFRRCRPVTLLLLGFLVLGIGTASNVLMGLMSRAVDMGSHAAWTAELTPDAAAIADEEAAFRSGWRGQMPARFWAWLEKHTLGLVIYSAWRAGGLMLLGMGLYKAGFLSGGWSARGYRWAVLLGIVPGLALVVYGLVFNFGRFQEPDAVYFGHLFNYWGSLALALGYSALVMWACGRPGSLSRWQVRLAAVGRMALTNYLMQTVICTSLFYGHGLGWFGRVDRAGQVAIVLAVWALQCAVSPWWLARFRFGPCEWLWRCLTYGRIQPLRREAIAGDSPVPSVQV